MTCLDCEKVKHDAQIECFDKIKEDVEKTMPDSFYRIEYLSNTMKAIVEFDLLFNEKCNEHKE